MLHDNPHPWRVRLAAPLPSVAGCLCLAAAPTFAVMALLTTTSRHAVPGMICSSAPIWSPLDGMSAMYLLMSAFHLPAWLRLVVGAGNPFPGGALESRHTCHSRPAPHEHNLPSTPTKRRPT